MSPNLNQEIVDLLTKIEMNTRPFGPPNPLPIDESHGGDGPGLMVKRGPVYIVFNGDTTKSYIGFSISHQTLITLIEAISTEANHDYGDLETLLLQIKTLLGAMVTHGVI